MRAEVRRHDPGADYLMEEGCIINELSNVDEDPLVSIAEARVPAGTTTRWHRLQGTTERYVLLAGEGLVEIGDEPPQRVGPRDVVLIPAGCRQRIASVGAADLVFLAICSPRFRADAYEDLE